jgi:pimeloyl-ACP methyl ester carboxylesterase
VSNVTEERFLIPNGRGHELALKRVRATGGRTGRPVVLVPGYGMNAFVFGFHPQGPSLEASLAARGLDVWSIELRGQGRSRGAAGRHGLAELALEDVPAALAFVLRESKADAVDLVGCSLGTALSFIYLAHTPDAPVGSVVSYGGLVTWVDVHPLLRMAFASPWLAGKLELRRTRDLARVALPRVAKIAPQLLSIYINAKSTDLSRSDEMVETVEDPNPQVNLEIAGWIKERRLVVRGVDVSARLAEMTYPLLCVVAKDDGIVPERTARAVFDEIGSTDKELLVVGGGERPIAHADLFLSEGAQEKIFDPVARFLTRRQKREPD